MEFAADTRELTTRLIDLVCEIYDRGLTGLNAENRRGEIMDSVSEGADWQGHVAAFILRTQPFWADIRAEKAGLFEERMAFMLGLPTLFEGPLNDALNARGDDGQLVGEAERETMLVIVGDLVYNAGRWLEAGGGGAARAGAGAAR